MAGKKMTKKSVAIIILVIIAVIAIIGGSVFTVASLNALSSNNKKNKNKKHKKHKEETTIEKTIDETSYETSDVTSNETEQTDSGIVETTEPATTTNENLPDGAADWTVLMYVCGTDLETKHGFASSVFDYIDNFPISDNINVIVQTGGAQKWNNDNSIFSGDAVQKIDIPNDKLGRYKIEDNKIVELSQEPLASMGSADTLASFINWGSKEYPAKKYILVIWDHGYTEPYGCMEHDEIFYQDKNGNPVNSYDTTQDVSRLESDNLNLDEFREGLQNGGTHFELVAFNTCLSASVEIASATAPYANYMVASEESIPAVIGIPYDFLGFIMKKPDATGLEVGRSIIEYYEKAIGYYVNKYNDKESIEFFSKGTMSVIDLSIMKDMDTYMADIWKELYLSSYDISKYSGFQNAAISCETYGSEGSAPGNLIDLKAFLINSAPLLTNTDSDEKIISLIDTKINSVTGKGRFNSNGISFFFPATSYVQGLRKNYEDMLKINGYSYTEEDLDEICTEYMNISFGGYIDNIDFIEGYHWYAAYLGYRFKDYYEVPSEVNDLVAKGMEPIPTPGTQVTSSQDPIEYVINYDKNGQITMDFTSGKENVVDVQLAMVNYVMVDGSETETFSYYGNEPISFDTSTGKCKTDIKGEWFRLDGFPVHMFIVENTEHYVSYAMPADINGKWAFIMFQKNKKTNEFEIAYCYYADPSTGVATNDMFSLKDGDVIEPLYYTLIFMDNSSIGIPMDPEGDIWVRTRDGSKITYDGTNAKVTYGKFFNDKIDNIKVLYSFIIKDAFGNTYQTESIEVVFDYGKLGKIGKADGYRDYSKIVNAISSEV